MSTLESKLNKIEPTGKFDNKGNYWCANCAAFQCDDCIYHPVGVCDECFKFSCVNDKCVLYFDFNDDNENYDNENYDNKNYDNENYDNENYDNENYDNENNSITNEKSDNCILHTNSVFCICINCLEIPICTTQINLHLKTFF